MKTSLKISFLFAITLVLTFSSCQKQAISPIENPSNSSSSVSVNREGDIQYCGTATVANLLAGQFTNMGSVVVNNDTENLYVTYTATGNWYFNQLHLYVGNMAGVPRTATGNPIPGQFPNTITFTGNVQSHTFIIPLSSLENCFVVAAHAAVRLVDANGNTIATETAWGAGTRFTVKGNWATYFNACKQICDVVENEGCSMSQGYWFASPVAVWPTSGVTVAGYTYTEAEAKAIWNSTNVSGIADSKKGFLQVATIYLSGSTVNSSASVWANVSAVEAWLATLGKLSPSNLPTGNTAVGSAAGQIGYWINANHCE